ncbi:hypothetical protein SEEH1514_09259, partial [Salmonella enterica subsp. enterica serovar Heidelberg str. N1514]
EVICKYVQIDPEMVTVQLEQKMVISPSLNLT